MMELLEPHVRTIVGIEPGKFPSQHPNIVSAMAESLPFTDETFDTVICSATPQTLERSAQSDGRNGARPTQEWPCDRH